ncbi:MARH6-like protein [Mya arenaria]|uniref:RING-type E3 ubiquitin transferase n=1 Tax=Mya arenaria TaxID=6604 RepID=A0ABY7ETL6_MYAAR|nr:MARH6-like protein [Mya arenaria]
MVQFAAQFTTYPKWTSTMNIKMTSVGCVDVRPALTSLSSTPVLVQWLKYSRKEFCELCKHRFAFTPIYSPDMPKRLPIKDILSGLLASVGKAVRYWFHYTLVTFAWLGVVPLTACRIYRCLFTGSVSSLLTLPLDMLSTENIASDCFHGCFVVACTLCAFISLVWLREQILHGGGPDWLEQDVPGAQQRNLIDVGVVNNLVGLGGGGGAGAREPQANQNEGNNEEAANENEEEIEEEGGENGNNGAQVAGPGWFLSLLAFCPYHIGHFTMIGLKMEDMVEASHFEGLMTTLIGYVVIAFSLVVLYGMCALVRLKRFRRVLGLCYVVVKVKLLVVVEIGSMFDATLKDRKLSFHVAPGTSMFIHWLVGMVYVFYFASFILLLREVLRPGVLWFLRNLNDPEFNPIQEMIHLPVYRHTRRFVASVIIFGSTVLLMLWLPVRVIRKVFPVFLPYNVMLSSEAPVSELSLELLLLQVVLPALLEQGHTRMWLKGLDHVIEGDHVPQPAPHLAPQQAGDAQAPNAAPNQPPAAPPAQGLGLAAAHQAMLQGGGPVGFQSYKRPNLFYICLLVGLMCLTLFATSVVCLILPVYFGRNLMSVWMGDAKVHELYTAACGLYVCWLMLRIGTALKTLLVAVILMGLVPLLLGLLFELVVVAPLRVSLDQTPVFFPWQVYNDGLRNMNLKFILYKLCVPVIAVLGMSLSVPYCIARTIVPLLAQNLVLRRIYPFLLACVVFVFICVFQARQFKRLYEHIKNDKYLVGQRLVNYDPKRRIKPPVETTSTKT